MRFIKYDPSELTYVLKCFSSPLKDIKDHAIEKWESWWVVKTKNDLTLSTPSYTDSLGIYFQPRAGTGSPVIPLDEVIELHRIMEE